MAETRAADPSREMADACEAQAHCWHGRRYHGDLPATVAPVCCWCGCERVVRFNDPETHGPYRPSILVGIGTEAR
jgi:hypothetical protein